MSNLVGTYTHQKSENLDVYYQSLGLPYLARKMMAFTNPKITISNDGEEWTIATSTALRTVTLKFKLNEEYTESMPGGTLKNTTSVEDENTLKTVSLGPNDSKISRTYTRTDEGCVLTLRNEADGTEGKRYFKKV